MGDTRCAPSECAVSLIPLQLPLSPVMLLGVGHKLPHLIAVRRCRTPMRAIMVGPLCATTKTSIAELQQYRILDHLVIKLIVPAECWLLAYLAADADRNAISPALLALETSPAN